MKQNNEKIIVEKLSNTIKDYNAEYGNKKFGKIITCPGIVVTIRDSALSFIGDFYLYKNFPNYQKAYDKYISDGETKLGLKELNKFKISNFSKKNSPEGDVQSRDLYKKYSEYSDFKAGRDKPSREEFKKVIDEVNSLIEKIINSMKTKEMKSEEAGVKDIIDGVYNVPKFIFESNTVTQEKVESLFNEDIFETDTDEWTLNTQEYTIMQMVKFITDFVFGETPGLLKYRSNNRYHDEKLEIQVSRWISQRFAKMKLDKNKLKDLRRSLKGIWQNNNLIILIDKVIEHKNPNHWDILNIVRKYSTNFDNMEFFKPSGLIFNDIVRFLDFYDRKESAKDRSKYIGNIKQIYTNYDEGITSIDYQNNIDILMNKIYKTDFINGDLEVNIEASDKEKFTKLFTFFNSAFSYGNKYNMDYFDIYYNSMHKIRLQNQLSIIKTYVYFNMQDKFSLKEILQLLREHEYGEVANKKKAMKVLFVYEKMKEYFDLYLGEKDHNGTIGFGTGTKLYTDTNYLKYIVDLKNARIKFINTFIIPLNKSLDVLGEDKALIIHNDLRRIMFTLDSTWFFIPSEFNDYQDFFKNLKSRFIFEEISMSLTKWNGGGMSMIRSRYLLENFTIDGNIYEEKWWNNLFKALNSLKDDIFKKGNVEVSVAGRKQVTEFKKQRKYSNSDSFEKDWISWIKHLNKKKVEYLDKFNKDFVKEIMEKLGTK